MKNFNRIDELEKEYLIGVDPIKFINELECGYIFYSWIERDLYLSFNNNCNQNSYLYDGQKIKEVPVFNNISIIGVYNIISNLVSIFSYELLSYKHKKLFENIIKPFNICGGLAININCNTFSNKLDSSKSYYVFTYSFNNFIVLEDLIDTSNISIYEHRIFINDISKNDFLINCFFLYESFIKAIYSEIYN